MTSYFPAENYLPCEDLWVITTYYNPAGYRTKRENYERFCAPLHTAGIHLVTIECAFGAEPFELESGPAIIQVRGRDTLWLKERLINLAITRLPANVKKVAWLDGDILMANPNWAVQTAEQLDHWPIVQPCDSVGRMERNQNTYLGVRQRSFAYQLEARPESACLRANTHGHPGIAWAARRGLIEKHGLYDAAILGSGDELFCHAVAGGFGNLCVRNITGAYHIRWPRRINRLFNRCLRLSWPRPLGEWYVRHTVARSPKPAPDEHFFAHYLHWAQGIYAEVRGKIGYVPGMALHLWHGDPDNRQYSAREAILKAHFFDPATDLCLNADGVWEWASDKDALHQDVKNYFYARKEDG